MTAVQLGEQWFDYADVLVDVHDRLRLQRAVRLLLDHRRDAPGEHGDRGGDGEARRGARARRHQGRLRRRRADHPARPAAAGALVPRPRLPLDQGRLERADVLVSLRSPRRRSRRASTSSTSPSWRTPPELYEKIMGKPDAFELVTQGVRNLVGAGAQAGRRSDHQERHLDASRRHRRALGRPRHRHLQPLAGVAVGSQQGQPRFAVAGQRRCARESAPPSSAASSSASPCSRATSRAACCPGYEEHVADLREDKVLVITPRTSFALWESKISPNTYAEKCAGCRHPARRLPRAAARLPRALRRRRGAAAEYAAPRGAPSRPATAAIRTAPPADSRQTGPSPPSSAATARSACERTRASPVSEADA